LSIKNSLSALEKGARASAYEGISGENKNGGVEEGIHKSRNINLGSGIQRF